jgi:hypothetical protein
VGVIEIAGVGMPVTGVISGVKVGGMTVAASAGAFAGRVDGSGATAPKVGKGDCSGSEQVVSVSPSRNEVKTAVYMHFLTLCKKVSIIISYPIP